MDWSLSNLLLIPLAFLLSVLCLWGYIRTAHRLNVQDLANARSAHSGQITTGGGLIMALVCGVFFVYFSINYWLLLGFLMLAIIGFIDDRVNLSKWVRIIIQAIGITVVFIAVDVQNENLLWIFLIAISSLWWLNMFNFMDGANGMAALHIVISGVFYLAFFSLGFTQFETKPVLLASIMMAVAFAYLLFNYPKAYLFMGDSGSLSFALLIFFLALSGICSETFTMMQVAILHSVFIVDATLTLAIRVWRKEKFLEAHNQHIYQRLIRLAWPHWKVSMVYAVLTLLLGLLSLVISQWPFYRQLLVCVLVYLALSTIYLNVHRRTR